MSVSGGYAPGYPAGYGEPYGDAPSGVDVHSPGLPHPLPRPAVAAHTTEVYERLPDFMRAGDDAQQAGERGYPLLRYLSVQCDELQPALDRLAAWDYEPLVDGGPAGSTSALVDPAAATPDELVWLAQFTTLDPVVARRLPVPVLRAAIANVRDHGYGSCRRRDVAAAAATVLAGTRYARVYSHTGATGAIGAGGQWDVAIVTRASETPDGAAVVAAVERLDAAPAGVLLHHRIVTSTIAEVNARYGTTVADWTRPIYQLLEAGLS